MASSQIPLRIAAASRGFHGSRPLLVQPLTSYSRRFFVTNSDAQQDASGVTTSGVSKKKPAGGLWNRFVHWSYQRFSDYVYPQKADICNCGVDFGIKIPRPDLVMRDDIVRGTVDWRMQIYGAALYWHVASTRPPAHGKVISFKDDDDDDKGDGSILDPDLLRGADVLEVACMRGGGARYLMQVVEPRSYVASDNVEEHIEKCKKHTEIVGLSYQVADGLALRDSFASSSFDYVLCIQAAAKFIDYPTFLFGAYEVLRPGGMLLMCDSFSRKSLAAFLAAVEKSPLSLEACTDMSREVHAVGLCVVASGRSYLRIVARKPDKAEQAAKAEKANPDSSGE